MHGSSEDARTQSHQPRRVRRGRRAYLLIVLAVLFGAVVAVSFRRHREVTVVHDVFSTPGGRLGDITVEPFVATFASDSPVTIQVTVTNPGRRAARYTVMLRLQSADGHQSFGWHEVVFHRVEAGQSWQEPVSFPPLPASGAVDPVDVVLAADVTREAA